MLKTSPSAVVELNRAMAIAQRDGPDRGIEAIDAIADRDRLASYPFYHAAPGHAGQQRGNALLAREHFARALGVARRDAERRYLARRLSG